MGNECSCGYVGMDMLPQGASTAPWGADRKCREEGSETLPSLLTNSRPPHTRELADPSHKGTSLEVDKAGPKHEPKAKDPSVHMIICALDYKKTRNPLTCSVDGENMLNLARQCSNVNVEMLSNDEATVENARRLIQNVGARCKPGDYFVFYYAGHGAELPDQDGDEDDAKDEAFCFVDEHGQTSSACWLRDDDFATIVTSSIHAETKVLILADCCHSGTVADLDKPAWSGHQVISVSGCLDKQTSGDTGKGGIFTHAMLLAIEDFKTHQHFDYTVGDLHRQTMIFDDMVFSSTQDITIQARPHDGMKWPLEPVGQYVSPLRRASGGNSGCAKQSLAAASVDIASHCVQGTKPESSQTCASVDQGVVSGASHTGASDACVSDSGSRPQHSPLPVSPRPDANTSGFVPKASAHEKTSPKTSPPGQRVDSSNAKCAVQMHTDKVEATHRVEAAVQGGKGHPQHTADSAAPVQAIGPHGPGGVHVSQHDHPQVVQLGHSNRKPAKQVKGEVPVVAGKSCCFGKHARR